MDKDSSISDKCHDAVMSYCKLLTESSKNEDWFIYTGIILNVTLLIALTVFFEKMFSLSNEAINKKCRNSELEQNLNNVIAAFFILNVLVQIINIIIQAMTNVSSSKWNNCEKLSSSNQEQIKVANKRKGLFSLVNLIRIILIVVVITLLVIGMVLNNKCKDNRKHTQGDVSKWYAYFNVPRIFNQDGNEDGNGGTMTIWYDYSAEYKDGILNGVPENDLTSELVAGTWYFIPGEHYIVSTDTVPSSDAYTYKSEYYAKDITELVLAYKLNWDQTALLEYNYTDYNNVTPTYSYVSPSGEVYTHKLEEASIAI